MRETAPSNLRILDRSKGPPNYKGAILWFEGDPKCNGYRLFARSRPLHGHQPLVDDPFGGWKWLQMEGGPKWHKVNGRWQQGIWERIQPRRTWTMICLLYTSDAADE